MTARDLHRELTRCGVILTAYGDRLHVDAPISMLTAELRRAMIKHKAELLQLLSTPLAPAPFQRDVPPADCLSDSPCAVCGSYDRWRWLDGRLICRACLIHGNA
jgi:TubC N-terminal docking domain/Zinc-binding domain of primase-helicase